MAHLCGVIQDASPVKDGRRIWSSARSVNSPELSFWRRRSSCTIHCREPYLSGTSMIYKKRHACVPCAYIFIYFLWVWYLHFFSVNWWSKHDFPTPMSPEEQAERHVLHSTQKCNGNASHSTRARKKQDIYRQCWSERDTDKEGNKRTVKRY